jgi:hypothetical protein
MLLQLIDAAIALLGGELGVFDPLAAFLAFL